MAEFTHLHVHSEYSLLDGLIRVPDLAKAARDLGFDALALTDHGVMYGAVRFYQEAVAQGIKPIIGCELYVAARSRTDRESGIDRVRYHLTVLAENEVGYRNLVELVTRAQLEGFYYKPRVDRELLARFSDGLIVLSGCPSGELATHLRHQESTEARETLTWYRDHFPGRYYVEIMSHDIDYLPEVNRGLVALANEFDLPLVATNDVHFARPEDAYTHEVLLCIQTGTTMTDPDRMRIGDTYYMRSAAEMAQLFAELPQSIASTMEIAERCNYDFEFGNYKLPVFDVPQGQSSGTYLRRLCERGLEDRYSETTPEIAERLDSELGTIHDMGFEDYFLIVADLCRFARDRNIWWNVRGSGAGSIVAYALQITNIDPLAHGLIFERFLNPARISMPDIDLDFPDDQRDEVIRYAFDKYGHDRVAQIITFGTMGARAAIRDAGRALDLPLTTVDGVARLIPAIPGKPCGIDDALRAPASESESNEFYVKELAERYERDTEVATLIDTARALEGVARHASTHAAGVVIADQPLTAYLPLHRSTRDSGEAEAIPVTQFAMNDVERLGLLKVDFLGLSTLTVLRRAAELVERYHGVKVALDSIPLDDPAIYELLSSGNVTGVFQVEGAGMRRMLREMQPSRFEHIVAAIALYRPGPMEHIPTYISRLHGREEVTYRHPELEPILAETYGIIVYQEQIIQIARDLAGYNAGEADTIRKAVGKKIKEQLLRHRSKFVDGATARGMPRHTAEQIFGDIETFARYGFNKAHAADYAVIVCQTAWFKAHYPVEYMGALLSVDRDDTDKIALVAAGCHRMGIKLLPPDVGASDVDFCVEPLDDEMLRDEAIHHRRGIRFGLAAVKNVGEGPSRAIVAGRRNGPFGSLDEFCREVDLRAVGRRALESLIKAGALDSFGSRASLLATVEPMLAESASHNQAKEVGQMSLFGDALPGGGTSLLNPLPNAVGDPKAELAWEKELLGLYLSRHPLHQVAEQLAETVTAFVGDIDTHMAGQSVVLAGLVTSVRRITTRKGQPMAFARLEDLQGNVELTLFPRVYAATSELWEEDELVLIRGKVEVRGDRVQVLVDAAEPYSPDSAAADTQRDQSSGPPDEGVQGSAPLYQLTVTLPPAEDTESAIRALGQVYDTLCEYQGHDRFTVLVRHPTGLVELEFPNNQTRYCVGLLLSLEKLLGQGCLEVSSCGS